VRRTTDSFIGGLSQRRQVGQADEQGAARKGAADADAKKSWLQRAAPVAEAGVRLQRRLCVRRDGPQEDRRGEAAEGDKEGDGEVGPGEGVVLVGLVKDDRDQNGANAAAKDGKLRVRQRSREEAAERRRTPIARPRWLGWTQYAGTVWARTHRPCAAASASA
jgi:hypothetical protein